MRFRKPLILIFCLITLTLFAQTRLKPYDEYIAKYAEIAVKQQKIHGIPASITLAQGLLESGAGKSRMAVTSNNHFGIKCHNNWEGDTTIFFDDGENTCFRKYEKVEDSYEDHSAFLVKGKRYAPLFQLDVTDYKGWATGLKKAGYATDPTYAEKLIRIIDTYGLNEFSGGRAAHQTKAETATGDTTIMDKRAWRKAQKEAKATEKAAQKAADEQARKNAKEAKKAERANRRAVRDSLAKTSGRFYNDALKDVKDYQAIKRKPAAQTINPLSCHLLSYMNTTPYITAQFGDSFSGLSDEFGISESRIRSINEFPKDYQLKTGEPVYLDTKTTWWEGEYPIHRVKEGESMHFIAQKYGLKVKALYEMNSMKPGDPIKPGMKIKLRNADLMSPIIRAMNEALNKPDSTAVKK
jgi:LysM repeat protein